MEAGYKAVSRSFPTSVYRSLDVFLEGEDVGKGSIRVTITPLEDGGGVKLVEASKDQIPDLASTSSQNSASRAQSSAAQASTARTYFMPAGEKRHHFHIPVDQFSNVEVSIEHAIARYSYLNDADDLIARGVQMVNLDVENDVWPVLPSTQDVYDSRRPLAHFEPPTRWMNDPNGLCYFRGHYHLFFQFNPYGWGWDKMHWNHAVSEDLLHWRMLPVALEPQADFATNLTITGGAFSGSAVTVDEEGNPCAGADADAIRIYLTRHQEVLGGISTAVEWQGTALSTDGIHFGVESAVVTRPSDAYGIDFRDPKVELGSRFVDVAGENIGMDSTRAYMVVASNLAASHLPAVTNSQTTAVPGVYDGEAHGDFIQSPLGERNLEEKNEQQIPAMALFSTSLPLQANKTWRYEGPVLADRARAISKTYECPDLFALDGKVVAAGALMHYRDDAGRFQPVEWYIGDLEASDADNLKPAANKLADNNSVDNKLTVNKLTGTELTGTEPAGPRLSVQASGHVDFGNAFYATQSFFDDSVPGGRRVVFAWMADYAETARKEVGLAHGTMSLPRELHVKHNHLYSHPIAEVYKELVGETLYSGNLEQLAAQKAGQLLAYDLADNAYFADLTFEGSDDFSIILAQTQDERQIIRLLQKDGRVRLQTQGMRCDDVDFRASQLSPTTHIEVFVDRTMVEVFVNDGEDAAALQFPVTRGGVFEIEEPGSLATVELHKLNSVWR